MKSLAKSLGKIERLGLAAKESKASLKEKSIQQAKCCCLKKLFSILLTAYSLQVGAQESRGFRKES